MDDYDTLFAARHGRGALDPVPKAGETKAMVATSISPPMIDPELINPMERTLSVQEDADLQQREQMKPQMASPSADINWRGVLPYSLI